MSDLTPLPNPPCGAMCLGDSTVIVVSEWTTGYATAVWRCHEHVGESVAAAVRLNADAVVTVTPLAELNHDQPGLASATSDQPPLRLVR